MYCIKMQASAKTATVFDPSASHQPGNYHRNDGTARAHVPVSTRNYPGKESREEVQGSRSSWFQRLKPCNDVMTHEASATQKEFASCERADVGVRNAQAECLSQNSGSRFHRKLQTEAKSTLKRMKTIEGKCTIEGRSATLQDKHSPHEARRSTNSAVFAPIERGFGPWVKIGLAQRSKAEKVCTISGNAIQATTNGREFCEEAEGYPHSAETIPPKSFLGSMQGEAITSALCKPLSPIRSKPGLPPRPPCHKFLGLNPIGKASFPVLGPDKGDFDELAISRGQSLGTPLLEIQDRDVGKHGEASFSRTVGSLFENLCDRSMSYAMWHNKVSTDGPLISTRTGNCCVSCEQLGRPCLSARGMSCGKLDQRTGSFPDVATERLLEANGPRFICKNMSSSSPGTGPPEKFSEPGAETMKNGSSVKDASLEFAKSKSWQSLAAGGSQHGRRSFIEQVAYASTSATSPWELFMEPADGSKTAREQFVEVYNRARDELKNQSLSQNTSRPPAKELEGVTSKLTLGPSDAAFDACIEGQFLKHGQQRSRLLQLQVKMPKMEEQMLLHQSSTKKQDALTTVGSSQSKQVDCFQKAHLISKRPQLSSIKAVLHESRMEIPIQRMLEGSVVHGRELRTWDHSVTLNNPFCEQIRTVSTIGQDMKQTSLALGLGGSYKQNNEQAVASELGKGTRVTFEDRGITLAAEKVAASRSQPQSKPHQWLHRWHSKPTYSSNGSFAKNTQVLSYGKNDLNCPQIPSLKSFRDDDGLRGSAHTSSKRAKVFQTSSFDIHPSAAAMAIVGTAARQYCASHPEGKGSFVFWSGFGGHTYHGGRPMEEKGKEKVWEKANRDLHG